MSQWFYTSNRQQLGPVSLGDLKELASTGLLRGHDLVWEENMPDWVEARSIQNLVPPVLDMPGEKPVAKIEDRRDPRASADAEFDRPRRREDRERRRPVADYDDLDYRRPRPAKSSKSLWLVLGLGGGLVLLVIVMVVIGLASRVNRRPMVLNPQKAVPPMQQQPRFQQRAQKPWRPADKQPANVKAPIPVGPGVVELETTLDMTDDFALWGKQAGHRQKVYTYEMTAGQKYTIDMLSTNFQRLDPYLRLEDPMGLGLIEHDDIVETQNCNAQIVFEPKTTGLYRIIATSFEDEQFGNFTLKITPSMVK